MSTEELFLASSITLLVASLFNFWVDRRTEKEVDRILRGDDE